MRLTLTVGINIYRSCWRKDETILRQCKKVDIPNDEYNNNDENDGNDMGAK